ncbi:type II toxin-antitoxin system Phd/YefM family antitoxin [Stenomitos frigidus]|uniref:Antitoxin n=1 Tax=Stenomitos frigidus ULC18 TaxID=2107698 RepID=A0A2T1EC62_9CYAN|nr:type II toxin-antitoxin system prevent-host-death family antitoxin [Stenomitos frigidus]PSB30339.1 prevent-host-death family protein [Stenomitos frigidus ULC18]
MYQVTSDYAQNNFDEILDRASHDPEGVAIVQANKSFVLINQEELEALIETIELLKNPTLLTDIQQARQEYSRGEVLTADQIFG